MIRISESHATKQCSFQCIRLSGGMKEDEFLKYFVLDIFNQNFDMGPWEVVVASSDGEVLSEFRDLITLSRTCVDTSLCIRTVHLRQDDGLYETWDLLIRNFTRVNSTN